jgi:radical SAM protein with 4Fe4S-binding SPASM domain
MTFFRPLYTCGAFNGEALRSVMYNTARGTCYTFDGPSALLVGEVLAGKREQPVDTALIAAVTGATGEQVADFLRQQLMPVGLVHDHLWTDEEWQQYRKAFPPSIGNSGLAPADDYREALPAALRVSLNIELTYACNERCLHCFNEGAARSDLREERRRRSGMLTLHDYRRIIDEAVALGIPEVTVTGGDPFCHPHCWDILDYLYERNLAVKLFTNALALNSGGKLRRIARLALLQLSVSIYSADSAVHDAITRRPGSWQQSMTALRHLAEWPVPLNIKTPVFRLNARTYYGVRRMAHQLGAATEVTGTLLPGADGDVSIIEHLQTRPEALRIILMDALANGHVPADGAADGYPFGSRRGFPCAANSLVTISPGGEVSACSNIPITFGNVRHTSLREALLSPARLAMLGADQRRAFAACGRHDYCRYCHVPCYAGEPLEKHADGTFTLSGINGDGCQKAKIRRELCRQIQQGIDPLGGKTIEQCLTALPVEEVPTFRKKMRGGEPHTREKERGQ